MTINRPTPAVGSAGAPAHTRTRAAESILALDGELEVLVDEELVHLGRGDFLLVPPGTTHAFAPPRGKAADVLVVFTPGMRRFDFYRVLGAGAPGHGRGRGHRCVGGGVRQPRRGQRRVGCTAECGLGSLG